MGYPPPPPITFDAVDRIKNFPNVTGGGRGGRAHHNLLFCKSVYIVILIMSGAMI